MPSLQLLTPTLNFNHLHFEFQQHPFHTFKEDIEAQGESWRNIRFENSLNFKSYSTLKLPILNFNSLDLHSQQWKKKWMNEWVNESKSWVEAGGGSYLSYTGSITSLFVVSRSFLFFLFLLLFCFSVNMDSKTLFISTAPQPRIGVVRG